MRRSVATTVALAFTAVLAPAGSAFADGGSPAVPQPVASSESASPQPAPAPASATATPAPSAQPSVAPSPSASQITAVPKGAPNAGVPTVAASNGTDAVTVGSEAGAAVLLVGAGAFGLRRRSKARG